MAKSPVMEADYLDWKLVPFYFLSFSEKSAFFSVGVYRKGTCISQFVSLITDLPLFFH